MRIEHVVKKIVIWLCSDKVSNLFDILQSSAMNCISTINYTYLNSDWFTNVDTEPFDCRCLDPQFEIHCITLQKMRWSKS